eukprot:1157921-Pelagomonas_calceolata.AAC.1
MRPRYINKLTSLHINSDAQSVKHVHKLVATRRAVEGKNSTARPSENGLKQGWMILPFKL